MDPLALEALRFGVAILAGGIVAVISSVLAFAYARRAQREDAARRDSRLRRGLIAEIRENMRRLGAPRPNRIPNAPVVRTAWDVARSLPFTDATFNAIARGYNLGEDVNYNVALITARATRGGIVRSTADELAVFERAQDEILGKTREACDSFADALQLLGDTTESAD